MARGIEVIVEGIRYPSIAQACRAHNVSEKMVHTRFSNGWDIEKCIRTPKQLEPRIINLEGRLYMSLKDVAKEFDMSYETLHQRLQKGMSLLDAITTPVGECKAFNGKTTVVDGVVYSSIKEAAEAYGIDPYLVRIRIHNGWDKEKAFKTPRKSRRI